MFTASNKFIFFSKVFHTLLFRENNIPQLLLTNDEVASLVKGWQKLILDRDANYVKECANLAKIDYGYFSIFGDDFELYNALDYIKTQIQRADPSFLSYMGPAEKMQYDLLQELLVILHVQVVVQE